MNNNDARYKEKMKTQRENSRTKEKKLLLGDYVLVKQERKNKLSTPYEPILYMVRPYHMELCTLNIRIYSSFRADDKINFFSQ